MPTEKIPPKDRIVASFTKLANASEDLNDAVAHLTNNIFALERSLNHLDFGVSAWHTIAAHDEGGVSFSRDLGYTHLNNRWQIAIRTTTSYEGQDESSQDVWNFENAPKWMVIEAAGKLPELFETILKRVQDTTRQLKNRSVEAQELATAVAATLEQIVQTTGSKKK